MKVLGCFLLVLTLCIAPKVPVFGSAEVCVPVFDDFEQSIMDVLQETKRTFDVAMYSVTDQDLADCIITAYERGVAIRVYLDKEQCIAQYSRSGYLEQQGVPVLYSSNPYPARNDFAVFDSEVVITGFCNGPVPAGKRSNENLIINDATLAGEYLAEFERLWEGCSSRYQEEAESGGIPRAPPAVAEEALKQDSEYDPVVYITKTGKKYHNKGCWHVSGGAIPICLSEAKARGYTPCKVCKPPG